MPLFGTSRISWFVSHFVNRDMKLHSAGFVPTQPGVSPLADGWSKPFKKDLTIVRH
jgi:hypothetical protein